GLRVMKIPFTKAHGAHNDFLLTWKETIAEATPEIARAICERHTGVGADGWIVVERGRGQCDAAIHLFNSDGSEAEISGNGTRCSQMEPVCISSKRSTPIPSTSGSRGGAPARRGVPEPGRRAPPRPLSPGEW